MTPYKAQPLPPSTSAQKGETMTFTQALILGQGKGINTYSDSKYAILVLHTHATI